MQANQSKIILSAFYFGKFNNYFHLWLNSCKHNPSIDFILYTDNEDAYDYPPNVKKALLSFNDFRNRCQKKYDFEVSILAPYDICDYVPAFGDILAEDFEGYDFWGHCDIDLIFGNIRNFLSESMLAKYDKVSWRGHFSLYKNNTEINTVYKSQLHNSDFYKTIFTNPTNSLFAFEENEINNMLEANGFKIYKALRFADLKTCTNNFEMMHFSPSFQKKNKHQIFKYENGQLLRYFVLDGEMHTEEMMYIHFLKRPMSIDSDFNNINSFLILPNHFANLTEITVEKIVKWSKKQFYFSYYWNRLNWNYFKKRKTNINDIKQFNDRHSYIQRNEYQVIIDEHQVE